MFPWAGNPIDLPIDLFDELAVRAEEVRRWEVGEEADPKAQIMRQAMRDVGALR